MQVLGVVYDCDGVLFESRQANLAYYNQVLSALDEPLVTDEDRDRAHLCHTAASPRVFAELLGEERVDEALNLASEVDYRQFLCHMHPEPGMVSTLRDISSRLPLAVATNRGTSMPDILAHFDLQAYFKTVVTSRDVARPKPSPDMLLLAAERLEIVPQNLLFVGDSILDLQAAEAAGIRFVAYRAEIGAQWNIDRHEQLLGLISAGI